jgi:hypothetical protein
LIVPLQNALNLLACKVPSGCALSRLCTRVGIGISKLEAVLRFEMRF